MGRFIFRLIIRITKSLMDDGRRSRSRSRSRRRSPQRENPPPRRRRQISSKRGSRSRSPSHQPQLAKPKPAPPAEAPPIRRSPPALRVPRKQGEWNCLNCNRFTCSVCGENKQMANIDEPWKATGETRDPGFYLDAWRRDLDEKGIGRNLDFGKKKDDDKSEH